MNKHKCVDLAFRYEPCCDGRLTKRCWRTENSIIVMQHPGGGDLLVWTKFATKLRGDHHAMIAFILNLNSYAVRLRQFEHFANAATRHRDVVCKILAARNDSRLAKSGKPHSLRFVKLWILKCSDS